MGIRSLLRFAHRAATSAVEPASDELTGHGSGRKPMRAERRSHRMALAVLAAGLAIVVAATTTAVATEDRGATDRPEHRRDEPPDLKQLLSLPFVTREADGSIGVDFGPDPRAAYQALAEVQGQLDGVTITIKGVDVLSPAERQAHGRVLSAHDKQLEPQHCSYIPSGERSTDGSTTPYFGCDPATGSEKTGPPVGGAFTESLETALGSALAEEVPELRGLVPDVEADGGNIVVSFPQQFATVLGGMGTSDQFLVSSHLWFTAYSNGLVETVQFTVAGDCLAYAAATGGDMCVVKKAG